MRPLMRSPGHSGSIEISVDQTVAFTANSMRSIGLIRSYPWQVPSLIAKFESTGTSVPLQCDAEIVRSDGHAELPG